MYKIYEYEYAGGLNELLDVNESGEVEAAGVGRGGGRRRGEASSTSVGVGSGRIRGIYLCMYAYADLYMCIFGKKTVKYMYTYNKYTCMN